MAKANDLMTLDILKIAARAVVAYGLVFASPASAETPLTNDEIITNFNTVAFGNEYTRVQYQNIRKWSEPLLGAIVGKPSDEFDDMVIAFFDELIAATGHPISLVYSPRMQREKRVEIPQGQKAPKTNLYLIYDTLDGIGEFIRKHRIPQGDLVTSTLRQGKAHCMATLNKRGHEIVSAFIYFPSHHSTQYIRICIVEELTQIMGLPNDSDTIRQSIFQDRGKHNELTPQDRLLLRLLYDPRVTPGMERVAALRTIYAILNQIRPGGIRRTPDAPAQARPANASPAAPAAAPRTTASPTR